MFVDPIPRSFEGLMSWEQFMERVDVLSSEELEVRVADLLERQSRLPVICESITATARGWRPGRSEA